MTRRNRGVSIRQRYLEMRALLSGVGLPSHPVVLPAAMAISRVGIANLRKLGIREGNAVIHGCSSKGPWTLSSSRAVHEALSLEYLAHDGLPEHVQLKKANGAP